MDSLSQIVLGAATGELVLGRRIGNKALVWGAIGGTIPDLDVFAGRLISDPLEAMLFHRGISHSFLFCVVAGVVLGALLVRSQRNDVGWRSWSLFFVATFVTHVLLDAFTMYGTQLFAPFSNTRVAWATIAVADPLYTVPFLVAVIATSRAAKGSKRRRFWHRAGWLWSLGYLALTVANKAGVEERVWQDLSDQNLAAHRLVSNPTILNNVLWNIAAESDDAFYVAQYSIFDREPIAFHRLPKVDLPDGDRVVESLQWFSDGFLFALPRQAPDGTRQLNDLRFGTLSGGVEGSEDFIFRFLTAERNGRFEFLRAEGGPPEGKERDFFPTLWRRMKGN
jgi:inner membrane protein